MNYISVLGGGLFAFYWGDGTIWRRVYNADKATWSQAKIFAEDVREDYTAALCGDKIIFMCITSGGGVSKVVFDGETAAISEVVGGAKDALYWVGGRDDDLNMVYTIPALGDAAHVLVSQAHTQAGWGPVLHLDTVSVLDGALFHPIPVADGHNLIFYHILEEGRGRPMFAQSENRLAYREVFGNKIGRQNIFHKSAGQNISVSFLATKHAMHGLFCQHNFFGFRLVYVNLSDKGQKEVVVAEGPQAVHNTAMYIIDDVLHLNFMVGDVLYEAAATDSGGAPFGEAVAVKSFDKKISRVKFLAPYDNFLASHLLVDRQRPWEIKFCDEHVKGLLQPSSSPIPAVLSEKKLAAAEIDDYHDFFNNMADEFKNFEKYFTAFTKMQ